MVQLLRRIYRKLFGPHHKSAFTDSYAEHKEDEASEMIYDALSSNRAVMVARFGSVELNCISAYYHSKRGLAKFTDYIKGKIDAYDYKDFMLEHAFNNAGIFPFGRETIDRFSELMIDTMSEVDILGSWLYNEVHFKNLLRKAKFMRLEDIQPFLSKKPWTRSLEGKKVLVVHPYASSIEAQYEKRELLFNNSNFLPEFELQTLKAVQSIAGEPTPYRDWFEALNHMKEQIDSKDYDIAILGCGAYGFPLAAHIKKSGKKAVHLGGVTQLLFGIRGKRWDESHKYSVLINEHWIYPSKEETPSKFDKVEGGCYW